MKILGGKYKGRNFFMPEGIRPTQNVLRAAIFDILGHDLSGLSLLELFAGSGAVSLEAISRGAEEVLMVEHNDLNAKTIQENCDLLGIELGGNVVTNRGGFTDRGGHGLIRFPWIAMSSFNAGRSYICRPAGAATA